MCGLTSVCFVSLRKMYRNVFKLKNNVIVGELYKPPNASIDIFNSSIETVLKLILLATTTLTH